jgi:uncharacterized protein YndB with AHSA1/START domain
MATAKNSIKINAPAEKVFEYLTPENLPGIWPSLVEVKNIIELPNGGYSWDFVYKMAGMRFTGSSENTEVVPNERTVSQTTGGIESKISWLFQPEDDGTNVTFKAEYTVPVPLLGKLAEAIIVRQNEKEAEILLYNLKTRLEI